MLSDISLKLTHGLDKCLPVGYILKIHLDSRCSNPEQKKATLDNALVKKKYFEVQKQLHTSLKTIYSLKSNKSQLIYAE